MRDFDLRKLQLTELEILKEVDRICKKHHIRYFLGWGSALGAIRHHGFIPWDDDIDIIMEYSQYLKFKEVCRLELADAYYYQDCLDGTDYYLHFAKIRKNKTISMTNGEEALDMHWGIGIDIFPLIELKSEAVPLTMKLRNTYFRLLCAKPFKMASFQPNTWKKKLFSMFYACIRDETIVKQKQKLMQRFQCDAYTHLLDNNDPGIHPLLKKEVFQEGVEVVFEDGVFPVPAQYDVYLKALYGDDYMELPPIEKRINHGDIIVTYEDEEEDQSLLHA